MTPTDPVLACATSRAEAAFVAEQIRDAWQTRFVAIPDPGSDVLIGILRTLLNSIKTFSTASPDSRGYLGFLAGFLKNAGVRVDAEDDGPLDPLEDAGEAWAFDGDEHSRAEFYRLAQAQITAGHRERVIEVVQSLISGADGLVQRELIAFAIEIQKVAPSSLHRPRHQPRLGAMPTLAWACAVVPQPAPSTEACPHSMATKRGHGTQMGTLGGDLGVEHTLAWACGVT
ncbi:MAG: hypothetical protein U0736_02055 [Gemmataceae bacterium]